MTKDPTSSPTLIGLAQTDGDGLCRAITGDVCARAGIPPTELIGQFLFSLFTPAARAAAISAWERIVESRDVGRIDTTLVSPTDSPLPVTVVLTPARSITSITDHWIAVIVERDTPPAATNTELGYLRAELAETKTRLEDQVGALKEELAQANRAKAILLESIEADHRSLIAARDETIAQLTTQLTAARTSAPPTPPEDETALTIAQLRAENLALGERVRSTTDELTTLRHTLTTMTPTSVADATIEQLRGEIAALHASHADLSTRSVAEHASLEAAWREKVTTLATSSATARAETERAHAADRLALAEARSHIATLESTLAKLREEASTATSVLRSEVAAEHARTATLEHRAHEADQRQREATDRAETASVELRKTLRARDDIAAALVQTQAECESLRRELDTTQSRLHELTASLETLHASTSALRHERDSLRTEFAAAEERHRQHHELVWTTADDFFERISTDLVTRLNRLLRTLFSLPEFAPGTPVFSAAEATRTTAEDIVRTLDELRDTWCLDTHKFELQPADFPLRSWWSNLTGRAEFKAAQRDIRLNASNGADLPEAIHIDGTCLDRSLSSLLEYLLTSSDRGTTIECGVRALALAHGDVELRFELTSMSPAGLAGHTPRISVSVAERIIELLGGTLELTNYPGEHQTVTVTLRAPRRMSAAATPLRRRRRREEIEPLPALPVERLSPRRSPARDPMPPPEETEVGASEPPGRAEAAPPTEVEPDPGYASSPPESLSAPPPHTATPPAAPEDESSDGVKPSGLHILIAEDNRINQRTISAIVRAQGHTVTVVGDGRAAVSRFNETPIDLALIDCEMPVLDGYAATREIRALEAPRGRRTPVIAMTVYLDAEVHERCLDAGMDELITKPIQAEELSAILRRLLGHS